MEEISSELPASALGMKCMMDADFLSLLLYRNSNIVNNPYFKEFFYISQ